MWGCGQGKCSQMVFCTMSSIGTSCFVPGVWSCVSVPGVWPCVSVPGVWPCVSVPGVWPCVSGVWPCVSVPGVWPCVSIRLAIEDDSDLCVRRCNILYVLLMFLMKCSAQLLVDRCVVECIAVG